MVTTDSLIVGTWRLDRFEIEPSGGPIRPWGKNAHGLLIYSQSGHMSVSINKDVVRESKSEHEDIFDSILFYSGTYKVEGELIRHQVTEASNPQRIGTEMLRYVKLEHNTITLTTPTEGFGRAILVWKRA